MTRTLADALTEISRGESTHVGIDEEHIWAAGFEQRHSEPVRELPPELGRCTRLESFYIRNCPLMKLPAEIGQLTRLQKLEIDNTHLGSLPPAIGSLSALWCLTLRANRLRHIPDEIGGLVSLSHMTSREERLERLPDSIGVLPALSELDITDNQIVEVPSLRGTKIWWLFASRNRMTSLPEDLGSWTTLKSLDLERNAISHLPSSIGDLPSLRKLNVSHNRLEALPATLGKLGSLTSLEAANNQIRRLPPTLGHLAELEHLDLRNNHISEWPRALCALPKIETIYLEGNPLNELPAEVVQLRSLVELRLYEGQPTALPVARDMKRWDVFISHASEDKDAVAVPLAESLRHAGLRVWIDKQEIGLGDSIRQRIDEGIAQSRFGIVIVSPRFLEKVWTQRELGGLMAIEDAGQKVLLPVWHGIAKADVARVSPLLADRAAADTARGIAAVAGKILNAVLHRSSGSPSTLFPSPTRRLAELIERDERVPLLDFLTAHSQILLKAFDARSVLGDFEGSVVRLPRDRDAAGLKTSTLVSTSGTTHVFYVAFASTAAQPVGVDASPTTLVDDCVRLVRCAARADKTPHGIHQMSVVLCGRRELFSDGDRERLRAYASTLRQERIEIRSYDWLLDASLK